MIVIYNTHKLQNKFHQITNKFKFSQITNKLLHTNQILILYEKVIKYLNIQAILKKKINTLS
jgi:hypothetical protein